MALRELGAIGNYSCAYCLKTYSRREYRTIVFVDLLFYNLLFRLSSLKCKHEGCLGLEEKIYKSTHKHRY